MTLWDAFRSELAGATFTDLTHPFHPGQPHFEGFPDEETSKILDFEKGDGFQVHRYAFVGQWGTHVDPPVHFIEGGRTLDAIPVSEMLLPLVVIDISARATADPDTTATLGDLAAWESRNGWIPERCFVALRTGWVVALARRGHASTIVRRTACRTRPAGRAPCWTHLFEQRGILAIGHEQIDTDPGVATSAGDFGLEHYVLSIDRWQIELLVNLDRVPEKGALIMATWPKAKGGSGFPARAVAIHR